MGTVNIAWKFDQDKLNAAIAERIKVQGRTVRTFAQIVNHALYSVALKAQHYTPKATSSTVESVGTIDVSMNVTVNYVVNEKQKSVPKRKPNTFTYGPGARVVTVALAKLIVLARADISKQGRATGISNYNVRTGDRWQLPKDALKGGNAKILDMMHNMVKARHSSEALLKAGWGPAQDILRPYLSRNQLGGSLPAPEKLAYTRNQERLGTAVPAKEGWVCWGSITNDVGDDRTAFGERQRRALHEFGTGPLQRALSEEAELMVAYTRKYLDEDAEDFNRSMR